MSAAQRLLLATLVFAVGSVSLSQAPAELYTSLAHTILANHARSLEPT